MARKNLPPALPPEVRPVGQLVAESLRLYQHAFWSVLPIGIPIAVTNQISAGRSHWVQVGVLAASIPLLTAAYLRACLVVIHQHIPARVIATALAGGLLVILPVPLLVLLYVLPAVAWLALVGLVVPVVLVERLPLRAALGRAVELARADYVHAISAIATATIIFALSKITLILLLHGTADAAERVALFLADLVLSPVLFLVPALLYFDQAARVVKSGTQPRRRGHADVHPSLEPDASGRADAEVES